MLSTNEQGQNFKTSHSMTFNTATDSKQAYGELKVCSTTDLDPLDNCQPVNCQMKYLGCRNYFDQKDKRCQKIPHCISDPMKELPDLVLKSLMRHKFICVSYVFFRHTYRSATNVEI